MGVNLHPSQKRSSCEACRKHKLRCKREESEVGPCARCARLNLECVLGQQKKVGRPRRSPADIANTAQTQTQTQTQTSDAAPFDASSLFGFDQSFGALDSGLATTNLVPFFYQSPQMGLSQSSSANISQVVDFSFDGSLPWDSLGLPFQSTSSGSTPSWPSSDSASTSTPTSTSSNDDCHIDLGGHYSTAADKPIDPLEAMTFLSKMNLDMHARTLAIGRNRESLTFMSIVCSPSPLFIDDKTMVQFMICATQDLVQILSRLRNTRREPPSYAAPATAGGSGLVASSAISPSSLFLSPRPGSSILPSASPAQHLSALRPPQSEPLSPPIFLLIASIFVQIISAYELILYHTAARMICLPTEPMVDMKDIIVGGLVLKDSCSLGIVFTELVTTLLERSERMLGIDPATMNGDAGLLSPDQKESLWRELGGSRGAGVGKARAASVRVGLENAKRAFIEASMAC